MGQKGGRTANGYDWWASKAANNQHQSKQVLIACGHGQQAPRARAHESKL